MYGTILDSNAHPQLRMYPHQKYAEIQYNNEKKYYLNRNTFSPNFRDRDFFIHNL